MQFVFVSFLVDSIRFPTYIYEHVCEHKSAHRKIGFSWQQLSSLLSFHLKKMALKLDFEKGD